MTRFGYVTVMLGLVFVLGAGFVNEVKAQVGCVQGDSIAALTSPMQSLGDPHYPCGNRADVKATWTISDEPHRIARLRFRVDGANWDYGFYSGICRPGPDSVSVTLNVNSRVQCRLFISEYVPGNGFIPPATLRTRYFYYTPY